MKMLKNKEANTVAGGNDLAVTYHLSTTGISEICLHKLLQTFNSDKSLTTEEMFTHLLSGCNFVELDLLEHREENAMPFKIEVI